LRGRYYFWWEVARVAGRVELKEIVEVRCDYLLVWELIGLRDEWVMLLLLE
jgi:hypothetical protein